MDKSLDEVIAETMKSTPRKGGKGGKGAKGGKGGKGRGGGRAAPTKGGRGGLSAAGAGRNAGQRSSNVMNQIAARDRDSRRAPAFANARTGRGGGAKKQDTKTIRNRVLISGLPSDWEEQHVLRVVETAGAVDKLTIFFDPSGRPTGNALVTYHDAVHAKSAVHELDGARLGDKEISVSFAKQEGTKTAAPAKKGGKGNKGQTAPAKKGTNQKPPTTTKGKGKTFGRKGGKGGKGGGKGAKESGARVERKEVSKDTLDSQLEAFLQK